MTIVKLIIIVGGLVLAAVSADIAAVARTRRECESRERCATIEAEARTVIYQAFRPVAPEPQPKPTA